MILSPRICSRHPQLALPLYTHRICPGPFYLRVRTYTTPRPCKTQTGIALQRSQTASVALNPPSTTYPPLLDLPEKLTHLPKYKYYFRLGKAYGVFYKSGLKAIWTNYKLAQALPNHIFSSDQAQIQQAVRDGLLSRADFQLICRTWRDINKIPLFALIWLVCGEFTPLIVIYFTGIVPRTIWIPKQVQKAREDAEKRRAKSKEESVVLFAGPPRRHNIDSMPNKTQHNVLKSYAQSLGLYPAWWDLWVPALIPTSLIRRRVYRRLGELEADDFAIKRDGGVGKMELEEVRMACEERGIDTLGKEGTKLRGELERWIEQRTLLPEEQR